MMAGSDGNGARCRVGGQRHYMFGHLENRYTSGICYACEISVRTGFTEFVPLRAHEAPIYLRGIARGDRLSGELLMHALRG